MRCIKKKKKHFQCLVSSAALVGAVIIYGTVDLNLDMESKSQVQIPSPFLISSVTLEKLLTPHCPHLQDGDDTNPDVECCWGN